MTSGNDDYAFRIVDENKVVKMVALGVGGMGNNSIENLARVAVPGLELYSLNTDVQPLRRCRGSKPVQLGAKRTGGKGAGGDSDIGRLSAEDDAEKIKKIVCEAELVFIASGMGGGTGTGATSVIARICKELGILTVCIVTMPMDCEGKKRSEKARVGLSDLRKQVDSLLVIENENLSILMDQEDISIIEVFRRADKVVVDVVSAVTRIINSNGYINLDLADLKKVLQRGNNGSCLDAYIGVGEAIGENRAMEAAERALSNPLMRAFSFRGAANLMVNVVGSEQMGHKEAMVAIKSIVDRVGDLEREIFMGVVPDNNMGEKLSITVIATGLFKGQSTVIPMSIGVAKAINIIDDCHEVVNSGGIKVNPDSKNSEVEGNFQQSSYKLNSGPELYNLNRVSDGLGVSPLIRKDEWQVPAYLRVNKTPHENISISVDRLLVKAVFKEAEAEPMSENITEKSLCRQALYNMAS